MLGLGWIIKAVDLGWAGCLGLDQRYLVSLAPCWGWAGSLKLLTWAGLGLGVRQSLPVGLVVHTYFSSNGYCLHN